MITILFILCILLLVPALMVSGYYWFLALYALKSKGEKRPVTKQAVHSFAIIIPAHNEEKVILSTLRSCEALDYPKHKYQVFVVADHCTDNTAKIALGNGVVCLQRHAPVHKGKGPALSWAFQKVLPGGYDAMIILDADCQLDAQALIIFDHYLSQGYKVLQANDAVDNPDVSPTSYALAIGNLIENELFYFPKSQLNWSVFLRGTGSVFHREVIQNYPWNAHSIVEDLEYSIFLLRKGINPKFINEVKVRSGFPINQTQLKVQRTRWAGGNLNFGKKHALRLIWDGLKQRRWRLVDGGWTLLVLSRPLVLLEILITLTISLLCFLIAPGTFSILLLIIAFLIFLSQGAYFLLGMVLLGLNWPRAALFLKTPWVVLRMVGISMQGLLKSPITSWNRTPR
jgi:cellulose synthase/poly-beta-1,6-N-acetylglucosamine synthase-like glycosyltransferase